jgi:hypothetical protein
MLLLTHIFYIFPTGHVYRVIYHFTFFLRAAQSPRNIEISRAFIFVNYIFRHEDIMIIVVIILSRFMNSTLLFDTNCS